MWRHSNLTYSTETDARSAFAALPEGTVPMLLEPKNKQQLTKVLTYHVAPGRYDAAALIEALRRRNGRASLTTGSGETLWIMMNGDRNVVVDGVLLPS